jgi:putative peptidoglycan lipid II flippase
MKLLQSTAIVSSLTFLSRIFGLIRESIVASVFGASAATDAFLVAFRIPNMLRQIFNEGAFATAFVPVLSDYKANRSAVELRQFINHICGTLAAILLVVAGTGILLAPALVMLLAPGFQKSPEKVQLTTDMLRITFGYIFFVSMCGFAGGIMNTHKRFAVPALTPILLNVGMIFGALVLAQYCKVPIYGLAWGVLIGGALQLLIQFPALWRLKMMPKPRWGWKDSGVQRVIKLMVPSIFGASVAQINLLVDIMIASFLMTGAVTWLSNAERLLQFPQGVFGVALAAVILPHLSGKFAGKDERGFAESLDWSLRTALVIAMPAMISLMMLAQSVIWLIYGRGKYTAFDVHMASLSLSMLAIGLPAFIAVKVLAPGFFSRQDTRTPVKAAMSSLISNIILNFIFVGLSVYFSFYAPHAGMSLATALAGYINAGLLLRWLIRDGVFQAQPGWARFGIQLGAASAVLIAVLGVSLWVFDAQGGFGSFSSGRRALGIACALGAGGVGYLGTLWLLGLGPKQIIGKH